MLTIMSIVNKNKVYYPSWLRWLEEVRTLIQEQNQYFPPNLQM